MTQNDIAGYCKENGVPTRSVGEKLRVMDATQLPMHMREMIDDRGFLKSESVETLPETTGVDETKATAEVKEETSTAKRKAKKK